MAAVMRVATSSSVIGSRRHVRPQAAAMSAVIAESGSPARSRSVRYRWVAKSRSPMLNQVGTP